MQRLSHTNLRLLIIPAIAVAAIASLAVLPTSAPAGSATGTMNVTATVIKNCGFTTGTLAFGNYDPVVANATTPLKVTDSTTALSIACTKGTTATISLNNGLNSASCTGNPTCMSDGAGDYLNYSVYTNNTFATVWNSTNTVSYTSTGIGVPALKVNGEIPAGLSVPAGSYTDTITATATF
jgi:spore coat protein U-like protein